MANPRRRIGLISDSSSVHLEHRTTLVQQLTALLPNSSDVLAIERGADVGTAYRELAKAGCDVIAIVGDGATLGAAMAASIRGRDAPALLPLPATLSMRLRGRWTRRRDSAISALARALDAVGDGRGKTTPVRTLRVSSALHPRALLGFDFLAGAGYRVIEDNARTVRRGGALFRALEGARTGLQTSTRQPLEGTLNDARAALSDTFWATARGASGRPAGTFAFATGAGSRWRRTSVMLASLARQPLPSMAAARRLVVVLDDGFALDGEIVPLAGAGMVTVESGPAVNFFEVS